MEGLNFERLIQNYLNHCKYEKGLDEKTMKAYKIDLAQYASTSSDPNALFTKEHLQLYIAELHSKYAIKSVKRKIASLKAFFNYLEYEEIFPPQSLFKDSIEASRTISPSQNDPTIYDKRIAYLCVPTVIHRG